MLYIIALSFPQERGNDQIYSQRKAPSISTSLKTFPSRYLYRHFKYILLSVFFIISQIEYTSPQNPHIFNSDTSQVQLLHCFVQKKARDIIPGLTPYEDFSAHHSEPHSLPQKKQPWRICPSFIGSRILVSPSTRCMSPPHSSSPQRRQTPRWSCHGNRTP